MIDPDRDPTVTEPYPSSKDLPNANSTAHDEADMHRMGKSQQLKRTFRSVPILGLTLLVMSTWVGVITPSAFPLVNGGRGGMVWGYIAIWFCSIPVVASLAEMASMAPTSGGQYFWVSELAPRSTQKLLSYLAGWLSALGWQAIIAVAAYQCGNLILVLATLQNPGYEPTLWQGALITMAICVFSVLFNISFARHLPIFEYIMLAFHVIGFFAMVAPLWALAPKASSREVFFTFENHGNWSSIGASVIVGQLTAGGAFIGSDSAAHMAEEVTNASLTVPRMMLGTILINGLMGLGAILTFVYSIQDVQIQIVDSTAVYPFIDIFRDATGSNAAAIGMTVPIALLSMAMCINASAAASRQAWSFARDDGLPFRGWFCKLVRVRGGQPFPLNAMIASLSMAVILSLLNLGGTSAFNSIMGLVTGAVGLTYALSIGTVLWRRLFGDPLPPARWSLGRFGLAINAFAMLYESFITVISFFPEFAYVTPQTMNWGCAMFGVVAILSVVWYIVRGRKVYNGPVVYILKSQ